MANAIYPKYKEAAISGGANTNLSTENIRVSLIDTGTYTYSAAHDMINDVTGIVSNSAVLGTKTVLNGTFDAANTTFTAVSGATAEAIIIWVQAQNDAASRLIAYLDTGVTGLPVTPNGGDINLNFDAAGIFTI
jgi:type VI protein secretion system component Hcp